MDLDELDYYYNKFKYGEDNFHYLMQWRVKEILIVSTFYDAYTFEHDSLLSEQIVGEYHQLNLTTVPRITSVPGAKEAMRRLEEKEYDLVITTMRIGEDSPFELSRVIKEKYPDIPIILLLTVKTDIRLIKKNRARLENIDNVFLWNGDSKLMLAMIKYVEDKRNVAYDTENGFVQVILLAEDNITFNSIYLPLVYTEIMEQTQKLISQELNDNQKYYRMRTRPKVLITDNYEEAHALYQKYKDYLLCVMSDMEFYRNGELDNRAGLELLKLVKRENKDLPCILQSSVDSNAQCAEKLGVVFFHKKSQFLLKDLRNFIINNLGFGDFVFRDEAGNELHRAKHIRDFVQIIPDVSEESLIFHSKRNHFSTWLIAHGEFQIARRLRPIKVEDFPDIDNFRHYLIDVFYKVSSARNRGKILTFSPGSLRMEHAITRIGKGSLGGKGRGLAFFNAFLVTTEFENRFSDVNIRIPKTTIVGTSEFSRFVNDNELFDTRKCDRDEVIMQRFLDAHLNPEMISKLTVYLENVTTPIAVRSSGLLEDSQSQPFAGVYKTFMLSNNDPDMRVRLKELSDAIKLVYASVYLKETKQYIENLNYLIEEERMAVVIQEIVGEPHGDYFYPHLSGVGQSYNFYPLGSMEHADGVVSIAVGLGQSVVDGGRNYRFCPRYPKVPFLTQDDILRSTQTDFYALNLCCADPDLSISEYETLSKLTITEAEKHHTLYHSVSTYNVADDRIEPGMSAKGPRVVDFANILQYEAFPLSTILSEILDMSQKAMGIPVEIEFAVDLTKDPARGIRPTFNLLQVRPMTVNQEELFLEIDPEQKDDLILYTEESMGNGIVENVRDIIYVDPERFDKTETMAIKREIEALNAQMREEDREYILMGPGRWGSRDRFLGIPVVWSEINKAKVIVEVGLEDFEIEPSQGTHFFHNVVAMNVGYFNVPQSGKRRGFVDWSWLKKQKITYSGEYCLHIVSDEPYKVIMDGKKGVSGIYKSNVRPVL